MDAVAPPKPVRINPWLPYWAVLQADIRQTLGSWVYRTWVAVSLLLTVGYLLYRYGAQREARMLQFASNVISDLLIWSVLGSVTLIIVLTVGSISGERGTLADSVLSRGISRYQYFFAKWHARLIAVLGTFLVLGVISLAASFCVLQEDLSFGGCTVALLTVAVLLAVVVTCGVTFSAVSNNTLVGITTLWLLLYGTGFLLTVIPARYPTPYQTLTNLPHILRGYYNWRDLGHFSLWCGAFCLATGAVGTLWFSRRDV
jgi:ABC-type transport system involved in multi-copper enzyme maturation permease subunit